PDPSLGDRAETSRARRSCSQNRTRPTSLSYVLRSSADWRRILQPALAPEFVEAASEPERRLLADVAFEALAVIADLLDDVVGPVLREPSHLTHLVFDAEHAPDFRILGFPLHVVDVGLGDALLLGDQHDVERPADDVAPAVVAMADGRPERLLGDDLRQDDVVARILQLRALGGEA